MIERFPRWLHTLIATVATLLAFNTVAHAQLGMDEHTRWDVSAGSEAEHYLRALQVVGLVRLYPWTVRPFGADELPALVPTDSQHPWHSRFRPVERRWDAYILVPEITTVFNSTMPFGANDGALWAGRGPTFDARFGFGAKAGPVSLIVAPEMFRAQNWSVPLQPNGQTGPLAFGNAYTPTSIDEPQRFGDRPYKRFDWGQTTLRIAPGPLAFGWSNANEYWGPATVNPVVLGNNAPGFPHVFVGSAHPINLWALTVQARGIWGRLDQSDYSPRAEGETRRFGAGAVGAVTIRGLPGLEIGASRFYHETWPADGPKRSDVLLPFTLHNFAASRANRAGLESQNQLASIFARWNFPDAGIEAYGEFGRDDYGTDNTDVLVEPDHESAYTIGLQRAWHRAGRIVVIRAEIMDARITHLARVRGEVPFYIHSPIIQGHTELGQVLGAPAGRGGGGTDLGVDIYTTSGRWTFGFGRRLIDESKLDAPTVDYGLSAERLWFTKHADVRGVVNQVIELNHAPNQDLGNLNLQIGVILHW